MPLKPLRPTWETQDDASRNCMRPPLPLARSNAPEHAQLNGATISCWMLETAGRLSICSACTAELQKP